MKSKHILSRMKEVLRRTFDLKFHLKHAIEARNVLKSIEKQNGKTNPADIRRSREYAHEVLGHARFSRWLYVYSAIAGQFKEGWIPDDFYGCAVAPRLKGNYGKISSLKPMHQRIFDSSHFPDRASIINGLFLDRNGTPIRSDQVVKLLFEQDQKIVFKVDSTWQGKGIHIFDKENLDLAKVVALGNGLFQGFINQHELFSRFDSKSVATLRMTTVFEENGTVSLRGCFLRVGIGEETHVQTGHEVSVPVDIKTGQFSSIGFLENWHKTEFHPTSKVAFAGLVVPQYGNCVKAVLELHKKVPFVRCIGWDLIVDQDDKVRIMEWNGEHNDIKFSEATQGPCFLGLGWERFKPGHVSWDDRT